MLSDFFWSIGFAKYPIHKKIWLLKVAPLNRVLGGAIVPFSSIGGCNCTPWLRACSVHVTDPFLTSKIPYFGAQIRDRPISNRDKPIILAQHPWQTHLSPWQVGYWSSVHVTEPFLTSKIPYFGAQIRDRPISHRDKPIILAQHPWQTHFSPWQVGYWSSVHVTEPFLTSKIQYFVAQIRDNPITQREKSILLAQHPWQTHLSPWQVGYCSSVHVTEPFLTSKIPYFVAQIRDRPISHRDKSILLAQHPWQTHFSPWQVGYCSSVHVTEPFLTSKIPYFVAQIRDRPISHRDTSIL